MLQNSGFVASSGHMAALYHDELYEMVTGRAGVARLQLFGVIFGHNRVVIYVEPTNGDTGKLTANTARTNLLLDEAPLPWADWAAEFRAQMPQEIKQLMEDVTAGSETTDHRQAWKERLRQIRDLFKTSKYRPSKKGTLLVAERAGGRRPKTESGESDSASGGPSGTRGGRAGGVYALFVDDSGEPGEEVRGDNDPEVQWISLDDNTRTHDLLEDRASKYLADQNILQINADFRVFGDMVDYWCDRYQNIAGARPIITQTVGEWYEQALVETVLGAHALKDSPQWDMNDVGLLWSEEALTAAVLQRYHIHVNVGRTLGSKLGSLKDRAIA